MPRLAGPIRPGVDRQGVAFRAARLVLSGVTTLLICSVPIAAEPAEDDRLFTDIQAARGERLYAEHCAPCHGLGLEGKGAPPLSGETFRTKWADGQHSLDDLYYIVRSSMPYSAPGKLSKQEYVDVIAYVLKVNGYRDGEKELPVNPTALGAITIRSR